MMNQSQQRQQQQQKEQHAHLTITNLLQSRTPFFIGRIAGIELQTVYNLLHDNMHEVKHNVVELDNNAGIHVTSHTSLLHYADKLLESYSHCTHIAEWEETGPVFAITGKSQRMIQARTPTIPKLPARTLEPYYVQDSWMSAIKGKRVLIVHPFVHTLQQQQTKLAAVFPGRSWFEECTLTFVAPPMTLAGHHEGRDWQERYNACITELQQHTAHDVALVAAGGYGMLLSSYLYQQGMSVMYVGGALQLFFGVIGKRWFDNKEVMALVTDDWIRPTKEDAVENCVRVEKGCYW